jgi:hypothetical protein
LSKILGVDAGNFNAFLSGCKTLSQERTTKLLQILNLNRMQLEAKFKPVAVQLGHFQQNGELVRLSNGGWVAIEGAGDDPNDTSDITGTWTANGKPSGDDVIDCLRQVQDLHRSAIAAIDDYLSKTQKGKVNRDGPTEGVRQVADNRRAGSRGDLLSVSPKVHLEYLQKERRNTEAELALQREIIAERQLALNARMELAELKKEKRF